MLVIMFLNHWLKFYQNWYATREQIDWLAVSQLIDDTSDDRRIKQKMIADFLT